MSARREGQVRHQLFLPRALSERLGALAAEPGVTKSAILADALRDALDRKGVSELQERFGARGYEKKCATRGGHAAPAEVWCLDQRAKKSAARNPGVLLALGISIALGVFVILKRARAKRPLK